MRPSRARVLAGVAAVGLMVKPAAPVAYDEPKPKPKAKPKRSEGAPVRGKGSEGRGRAYVAKGLRP